jgi:hypothetical protein
MIPPRELLTALDNRFTTSMFYPPTVRPAVSVTVVPYVLMRNLCKGQIVHVTRLMQRDYVIDHVSAVFHLAPPEAATIALSQLVHERVM